MYTDISRVGALDERIERFREEVGEMTDRIGRLESRLLEARAEVETFVARSIDPNQVVTITQEEATTLQHVGQRIAPSLYEELP